MRFTKMEGLGNDYIYLNGMEGLPEDLPALARRMSDRHFGVGSDGLICICPSDRADFKMRMFNADGSEGEMCGNGIRCLGKYVYDKGLTDQNEIIKRKIGNLAIVNIYIRCRILYRDRFRFTYGNNPDGPGAYIQIEITKKIPEVEER